MNIAKSSPLYDYWNSDQGNEAEQKRLLKLNSNELASNLFKNEPYKWENIYQSVVRYVISGDQSSVKALLVLLSTINREENEKAFIALDDLIDSSLVMKLRNERYQDLKSSKNFFTAIKILINIFINPYGLEIKKDKNHIYEKTGMFFFKLRKLILLSK